MQLVFLLAKEFYSLKTFFHFGGKAARPVCGGSMYLGGGRNHF